MVATAAPGEELRLHRLHQRLHGKHVHHGGHHEPPRGKGHHGAQHQGRQETLREVTREARRPRSPRAQP